VVDGKTEADFVYSDDGDGNTTVTWGDPDCSVTLVGIDADAFTAFA
jgi:hypothetical protein